MTARAVNLALGIWLFISAFLWFHTDSQMTNTWIVGLLLAAFAAIAFRVPEARWVSTALAIWLFISIWALPTTSGTFWNNLIVSVAAFASSLVPGVGPGGRAERRAPPRRKTEARREPPAQRPAA